jgi:hypothetical protein
VGQGRLRWERVRRWPEEARREFARRAKTKRLLRKHAYRPPTRSGSGDGGGEARRLDHAAQPVLDQAKALYGYWPEVEVGDRLFA